MPFIIIVLILMTLNFGQKNGLSDGLTSLIILAEIYAVFYINAKLNNLKKDRNRNTAGGSLGVRIGTPCLISKNGYVVGDVDGVAHLDTGESYSCWTCSNRDYCSK